MKKLTIDGQRIVNEDGEQVILSGINLVCKNKSLGYVEPCDVSLFQWFQEQGFNVIRLGLIWDGVEPEPGIYDDVYLSRIKQQIRWAEQHHLYVFLDMHQDLYSQLYGDGAPAWATLTDDLPHIVGDMWSDAYLKSPAVNRALDHFWQNTPAADGIGLQDHYEAMWRHVAAFFADCPNVIGYDMMNEPYPGTSGQQVFGAMIAAYAETVMGMNEVDMEQIAVLWFDDEKKQEILQGMADMDIYRVLMDSAEQASQAFDRDILTPFFNKIAAAVRSVDSDGFLMLETSYFTNMGVESGIELVQNPDGTIAQHQVYAPHGYDLVVDTDHYEIYNQERVNFIFSTHRKVQTRLSTPVLIGEWGAFNAHPATYELAKAVNSIFEQYLWSNTFWCWYDGFKDTPFVKALRRGFPHTTGGVLIGYHYDYDTEIVKVEYIPSGGETRIYHPRAALLTAEDVRISGAASYQIELHPYPNTESGWIAVRAEKGEGLVTIIVGTSISNLINSEVRY
ncbi:glycosyl hydrolase family 5 [Paenibacillus selenitireducens]|uniref:Glycosyl hydrolase family 5 n=1 Tax=Paenibacillus selenitireducens TaxID=1324314 RepID=A0A1T2XFU8_9BACL|nr:cellulase family glycosylhydrolase [Paenibacillus selenitireducens]OPA78730.1 glycosyl hydrolase family 5 [Paenibacillus selenitireducens]